MKKTITIIIFILVIYMLIGKTMTSYRIPDEAIRIRIVPNSNSVIDQDIKSQVKEDVEKYFYNLLDESKSIDESRKLIKENIPNIEDKIDTVFKNNNYDKEYTVNYGLNYFPEKEYKGVKYDAGMYESLYITIGDGCGDNWWCVLFPPLCMMEAEESDEIEYRLFVEDMFNKYLSIN